MLYNFNEFVNESYLGGGHQPLYHSTRNFLKILESDLLRANKPTFNVVNTPSVSFSRNRAFSEYGEKKFMLDADLLIRDGFVPKPIDEVGKAILSMRPRRGKDFQKDYTKSNPASKTINHNVDNLKTGEMYRLEAEYDERIYKSIPNLGKYVMEIVLDERYVPRYLTELTVYLQKYPHIIVTNTKGATLLSIKDIEKQDLPVVNAEKNVLALESINIK